MVSICGGKVDMKKFRVITICGSRKFSKEIKEVQKKLILEGNIVLCVELMDEDIHAEKQQLLGEMHMQKILMSDEVFICNVSGYIGESTKSEIKFALENNKKVSYLEKV